MAQPITEFYPFNVVLRHITHTQGDYMIGRIIFGTMWVMMWIVLLASGLGLIALLADGDYPLE